MEQYRYDEQEFHLIEKSLVPFAVYQFLNKRVVTIALSQGFCDIFGFTDRAEAYSTMDNNMYRDTHPDDIAQIADAALNFAINDDTYDVVYRSKLGGAYRIIHAKGEHIFKENGVRLAVVWYFDEGEYLPEGADEQSALNKCYSNALHENSLYRNVQYDYLTGLPNMSYFFELAEAGKRRMLNNGKSPAMLFIDFNGMKYFNQKNGFSEGDRLIRAFSRLLVKYFTNENCSRFGQDHFCVYTKHEGLEEILQKLFEECKTINDNLTLPIRVGIYLDKNMGADVCTACDRAKMACDLDRNSYNSHFTYFDDTLLRQSENRQYIIDNLDRALAENWIQVYYQPIIRAANGRVCDEEALSRWIDPQKGFLSPADFIPILEDSNLIYKLDLFITDKILEKMKSQADAGLYVVPNSVNLSRSDFDTCDIVAEIQKRVDAAGIPREKLTIEITESIIGSDFDYMKLQVERFQSLGFKVWMDDFGSGYSSLDVLQNIRFDLIKLDMRFMHQFSKNEKSKIILTELVKMALSLGIDTVCEGVETSEQVEFLTEIGCTKLQGFHFCKPIPYKQIIERYETGTQIGFENPEEDEYYSALGKINLYDFSVVSNSGDELFQNYFNTLPMSIIEANDTDISIVRGNKSYREFLEKYFASEQNKAKAQFNKILTGQGVVFMNAIMECKESGKTKVIDEKLNDGTNLHALIRRVAVNAVTGVAAFVVVILSATV